MGWMYLLLAGVFEIGFTTCMALKGPWATAGFLALAAVSFGLLTVAMKTIPLGTAYAVWTGIGAVGTAAVGILFFGDPITFWRVFFLGAIIVVVIGLKMASRPQPAAR